MGRTSIEWCSDVWNPVVGCRRVSPGCGSASGGGCYAEVMAARLREMGVPEYAGLTTGNGSKARWTGVVRPVPSKLDAPRRWRKPRRVFVNSMSDLFHEDVPDEFIAAVFGVMAACPQHTFIVLTKRAERMREWFAIDAWSEGGLSGGAMAARVENDAKRILRERGTPIPPGKALRWPLPNVHLGVSAENQPTADERVPLLLACPATVRWVSYEPALGPVEWGQWLRRVAPWMGSDPASWAAVEWPEWVPIQVRDNIASFWSEAHGRGPRAYRIGGASTYNEAHPFGTRVRVAAVPAWGRPDTVGRYVHCWNNIGVVVRDDGTHMGGVASYDCTPVDPVAALDWIVVGGESGPGARPFDLAWARSTIAACREARVAAYVKQLGARPINPGVGLDWPEGTRITMRPGEPERVLLRHPKGGDPAEWPEDLRVRDFPEVR